METDSQHWKKWYKSAQIIIEKVFKNRIMKELNELGINYSFLFPGLDGLSALINEETSEF